MRELISTGKYDKDIPRYIPGVLELKLQGMLEDIDTREKEFLTGNYYVNPNSIHICFPMKI